MLTLAVRGDAWVAGFAGLCVCVVFADGGYVRGVIGWRLLMKRRFNFCRLGWVPQTP